MREAVAARLRAWLADPDLELIGHDLKEVVRLCPHHEGRPAVAARLVDTMLMAYLVHSAVRSFGLATVALDRLFYQATTPADAGLGEPGGPLRRWATTPGYGSTPPSRRCCPR